MNRTVHEIPRYEDARAALANPDLVPEMPEVPEAPPAAEGKEGASMAWLRAAVPRFSSGETHARRRALVEAELARLDVARLRKAATRWPEAQDAAPYVVSTLAEALGYRDPHAVAEAVGTVSRVYFGGEDPEADAAVARLVELLSPPGELVDESLRQPGPDGPREPDGARQLCGPRQAGGARRSDGARQTDGPRQPDVVGRPDGPRDPDGARQLDGPRHVDGAQESDNARQADGPRGSDGAGRPDGPRESDGAQPWDGPRRPDGPRHPNRTELVAARICLLVQARDATAALVRHADAAPATTPATGDASSADTRPIEQLLHETLRNDPPVRVLRRVAARDTRVAGRDVAAGELVLLDATAAGPTDADEPLAFGAPPRVCPGREHAMALAAGALAHRQTSVTPFARLHRKDAPLLLPNAWDCASAAALAKAGFEAVGTTSLGVAASAGLPDGAGVTADATLDLARRLGRTPLLFTVDMEGGFSDDPAEVADLARQMSAAGAAGINLEDGRVDGSLSLIDQHAAKIAAVKAAVPELFVNARTDTYWLGRDRAATEERLAAYQQAGADGLFVPGLAEPDRIRDIATRFELPLNILYSPTGPTLDELAALGVRRVSLGSLLYRRALGEAVATARAVREGRRPTGDTLSYGEVQGL
ncbi:MULTISPECIES: isocitrate lyase/phosphoenolpyruvate mutase family protein [unclassified Streptomyces]|uniref:isocitrate lyase/phosphoenolpyruvate mutase family protein n=1 Tax=unclassified Streptomyces TaxID=2593676 RepID=UPI002E17C758|nr:MULTISPECIES: isocitrate lyase/phosphoenolpyruvate mutase family protein [unclassified Streptomyces]